MESPPPPLSATAPPHHNYSDSVDSSPRSRNTDSWDDSFPSLSHTSTKLRLMCSYGGHIVPRPHDKSLCYVGGDTRIVVSDRTSSLSDLSARLSKTLLNSRSFSLKYQLPNEDLDSLISVSTDEDLENMIEEYDRTTGSSKPSRLRLFLFPVKPDSSQSIGSLLDSSTKSDDWFLNALNGAGLVNQGFSDSASVNSLLGLDVDSPVNNTKITSQSNHNDREVSQPGSFVNCKNVKQQGQDVQSVPDSPMMESSSSFGSTSSSPSLANLPPIRVHVEDSGGGRMQDQKVGIEEQFARIGFGVGQKPEEGFVALSSPPVPANIAGLHVNSGAVGGEYMARVFSDEERSDHGVPVAYGKPPQPQPQLQPKNLPPQLQQKSSGGVELPSPDSVSSDSSITSAISRGKPMIYQDSVVQIPSGTTRIPANPVDQQKISISDPNNWVQIQQQVQEPGYILQSQFEQQQQQQFVHPGTHYIQHHNSGPVQVAAYYPVYPSQQHHQLDPSQYPMYYMPGRQTQAYNFPVQQPNISEAATTNPTTRPQTPPDPASMVAPPSSYNPTRNTPVSKPDMAPGMYRTPTQAAPQYVQVPKNQQQYVGFTQIHHPSQSATPTSAYEFVDPARSQIYYTQPLAPTLSTYQTMTAATAASLPDASAQLSNNNNNMKPHLRPSQPI